MALPDQLSSAFLARPPRRCADRRVRVTGVGAGAPRTVRVSPSTHHGIRIFFLATPQRTAVIDRSAQSTIGAHLWRGASADPGEPDGKGQARGQSRNARGNLGGRRCQSASDGAKAMK